MNRHVFYLVNDFARRGAEASVAVAPDGYKVTIEEPRRNLDQNAALHALIGDIAKTREWAGKKWDADTWKRLLTAAWMRTQNEGPMMLPAIDGHGIEMIYRRSSDLTKRECSELIDYIEAWHATSQEAA